MSANKDGLSAADFLPAENDSLTALQAAAQHCRGCALHENATQVVFGEGLPSARLMLVGEMPGNDEDLAGQPFVGPAGRVLNDALEAAGIERGDTYVSNVVKHFKWQARGKHRLHKSPGAREVRSCLAWLQAEIRVVQPRVFVCLGATAAKAMLGADFRVTRRHGELVASDLAPYTLATTHPSAILRKPDAAARDHAMQELIADLAIAASLLSD